MLHIDIDLGRGVAIVEPDGPLTAEDFRNAAALVDPYVESHGDLKGLLIKARSFPGWASFAALLDHFRFVRDHHQHVGRVALVTDALIGDLAESLARHFVAAQVKHFDYDALSDAEAWVAQPASVDADA